MGNENYTDGYAMDPAVIYGPAAGDRFVADRAPQEQSVLSNAPLDGASPAESEIGEGLTAGRFLASPVGMLLILLVPAYLVFDRVFHR